MTRPIVNPLPIPASSSDVGSPLVSKTDSILASLPPAADETNDVVDFLDAEQVRNQTNLTTTQQDTDQIEQDKLDVIITKDQNDTTLNNIEPNVNNILTPIPVIESRTYALGNFKGVWSQLSGILPIDSTVKHQEGYWRSLVNIPAVSLSEPSEGNSDWELLENIGNVPIGIAGDLVKSFDDLTATGEYLECDGSTYLKSEYPELTEKIGSGHRTFLDGAKIPSPTSTLVSGDGFNLQSHQSENLDGSYLLYTAFAQGNVATYVRCANNVNSFYQYIPNSATSNRTTDYGGLGGEIAHWLAPTVFCFSTRNAFTLQYRRINPDGTTTSISGPSADLGRLSLIYNRFNHRHIAYNNNGPFIWTVSTSSVVQSSSLSSVISSSATTGYFLDATTFILFTSTTLTKYAINGDSVSVVETRPISSLNFQNNITSNWIHRLIQTQRAHFGIRNLSVPWITRFSSSEGNGVMVLDLSGDWPVILYEKTSSELQLDPSYFTWHFQVTNSFGNENRVALTPALNNTSRLLLEWDSDKNDLNITEITNETSGLTLSSSYFGMYFLDYGFSRNQLWLAGGVSDLAILPTHNQQTELRLPTISPIESTNATSDGWRPKPLKTYIRTNTNTGS